MMPYKRGDIVLVVYPNTDLRTAKKRPALIIQSDDIDTGLPQRIVAMITSNLFRTGPTRVTFTIASPEGQAMALLTDSVVVTDNIATVLDREIDKTIGRCTRMDLIDAALRAALGSVGGLLSIGINRDTFYFN